MRTLMGKIPGDGCGDCFGGDGIHAEQSRSDRYNLQLYGGCRFKQSELRHRCHRRSDANELLYAWDLNFSPPPLGPVLTLNAGDVVNVDITFSNPTTVTVPGSNFQSSLFAVLLNGNYANCQSTPSTCQPDTSTSTVTLTDYSGPFWTGDWASHLHE